MSAVITDNQLILTASGTGYQSASAELRSAPPASADMMVFLFRAYYDSATGNEAETNYGWGNPACYGLSFSGDIPQGTNHSNFFGISGGNSNGNFVGYIYNANAFGTGEAGLAMYARSTSNGYNGGTGTNASGAFTSGLGSSRGAWDLPANPTVGAKFTGVWVVKKKGGSQDILLNNGYNLESLSLADAGNARTSGNTVWYGTEQSITETTNWRPSSSLITFPEHVVFGFPSGVVGRKMVVDWFKIEYYAYNQLIATT